MQFSSRTHPKLMTINDDDYEETLNAAHGHPDSHSVICYG